MKKAPVETGALEYLGVSSRNKLLGFGDELPKRLARHVHRVPRPLLKLHIAREQLWTRFGTMRQIVPGLESALLESYPCPEGTASDEAASHADREGFSRHQACGKNDADF